MKSIRLLKKHKRGCFAILNVKNKIWETPWVFAEHQYLGGVKYTKRGFYVWQCNDPSCKAKIAIKDSIVDKLPNLPFLILPHKQRRL